MSFNVTVLTLFPKMFPGFLGCSLAGKALKEAIWKLQVVDIRSFATGLTIDDVPYGGGPGMVMRPDVIGNAIDSVLSANAQLIYMTPSGVQFNQSIAKKLITFSDIIILCGRFEGIDQRVISLYTPYELSIGDYILSGGEPAAMVVLDACIRLLPGVLSNDNSLTEESFSYNGGLLEYPQYTKPREWRGCNVPEVLLSGHHKKIGDWRRDQSRLITEKNRPELLNGGMSDKFT